MQNQRIYLKGFQDWFFKLYNTHTNFKNKCIVIYLLGHGIKETSGIYTHNNLINRNVIIIVDSCFVSKWIEYVVKVGDKLTRMYCQIIMTQ